MHGALEVLLADGVIDEVVARLKSGKEADVYIVTHAGQYVAAKIYKERTQRNFKNNAGYKEGRLVRNSRTRRAMEKGSRFGQEASEDAWKAAESEALSKLYSGGVAVPAPVMFYEGVLLMELVVDPEGQPAPRLIEATLTQEEASALYKDLRQQVVKMLCCDIIHGDLSAYNILLGANGAIIIDFPQIVNAAANSRAEFFFKRDLDNLRLFFAGSDRSLMERAGDAAEIWRAYSKRELTPDFEPTGRFVPEARGPRGAGARQGGRPPRAEGAPRHDEVQGQRGGPRHGEARGHRGPPRHGEAQGHRGGPRHGEAQGHRSGPRHDQAQGQAGTPRHEGAQSHAVAPHHEGAQSHAGTPHHESAQGHAGTPRHEGAQGHAGTPRHEGAQGHSGVPQHEGTQGHAGAPRHEGAKGHAGERRHGEAQGHRGRPRHDEAQEHRGPPRHGEAQGHRGGPRHDEAQGHRGGPRHGEAQGHRGAPRHGESQGHRGPPRHGEAQGHRGAPRHGEAQGARENPRHGEAQGHRGGPRHGEAQAPRGNRPARNGGPGSHRSGPAVSYVSRPSGPPSRGPNEGS
jgi:RIO kinase 1